MSWKEWIRLPLRLLPRGRVVPILSGELRGARWITGASTHGCWLGTYERHTQRLFREHVRPGSVVYDVGANAGFFTLLASRLAGKDGRVVAFEPLPQNLEVLREHVRLNDAGNVAILPLAVAAHEGRARFHSRASPSMGSLAQDGELEVPAESLDRLVASGQLPPPDFIKMDIEGGEAGALAGARDVLQRSGLTLLMSTHGYVQHERCWSILRDAGLTLTLLKDGAADGDYLILATNAACR